MRLVEGDLGIPDPGANVARNRVWGDYSTGGSRGIRTSHEYVRKGGAAARIMLVQAAANEWKVPASECTAANSVITHKASNRTTTYGKVAEAAAKLEAPKDPPLKDPKDWKIIGKPVKRLDTLDKVTGKQVYGADIKLPNMLNAAIIDCPVFGGKVKSFDASAAEKMPGVKKIVRSATRRFSGGCRYLVARQDRARQGEDRMGRRRQRQGLEQDDRGDPGEGPRRRQAFIGNEKGNAKEAIAKAAKKVEATYMYPYQNHAPMEPMNTTALYTADRCEVWCPTQNGEAALAVVAASSGCRWRNATCTRSISAAASAGAARSTTT
jgi:isoquinoline 1-oxidoreductase beta subunit